MAETVLGAIPDARIKTGLLKSEAWVLVVTDRRLLGARVTDELIKHVVEQARARRPGPAGSNLRTDRQIGDRSAVTPAVASARKWGWIALRAA